MLHPSKIRKQSVNLHGLRTSVSLEDDYWIALKDMAARKNTPVSRFIEEHDGQRAHGNLSSALRLYVLRDLQIRLAAAEAEVKKLKASLSQANAN